MEAYVRKSLSGIVESALLYNSAAYFEHICSSTGAQSCLRSSGPQHYQQWNSQPHRPTLGRLARTLSVQYLYSNTYTSMAGFAVELSIVLCSFGLFIAYHIWFFLIHGTGLRTTRTQARDGRDDKFLKGKVARIQFADLVCRDNDTIAGIQQNRNALIGVSFLAGTVSLLAQKILEIVLDSDQQDQMKAFAVRLPAWSPFLVNARSQSRDMHSSESLNPHCIHRGIMRLYTATGHALNNIFRFWLPIMPCLLFPLRLHIVSFEVSGFPSI